MTFCALSLSRSDNYLIISMNNLFSNMLHKSAIIEILPDLSNTNRLSSCGNKNRYFALNSIALEGKPFNTLTSAENTKFIGR